MLGSLASVALAERRRAPGNPTLLHHAGVGLEMSAPHSCSLQDSGVHVFSLAPPGVMDIHASGSWMSAPKCSFFTGFEALPEVFDLGRPRE